MNPAVRVWYKLIGSINSTIFWFENSVIHMHSIFKGRTCVGTQVFPWKFYRVLILNWLYFIQCLISLLFIKIFSVPRFSCWFCRHWQFFPFLWWCNLFWQNWWQNSFRIFVSLTTLLRLLTFVLGLLAMMPSVLAFHPLGKYNLAT